MARNKRNIKIKCVETGIIYPSVLAAAKDVHFTCECGRKHYRGACSPNIRKAANTSTMSYGYHWVTVE